MLLIDTHAHYDFKEFDEDRKEVFEKLKTKVEKVVNIGINLKSCLDSIQYSKLYDYFYVAIGIHPQEVQNMYNLDDIENVYIDNGGNKIVAIGETGLDYHFDYPKELQKEYFIKHINLANKLNLPIIIHARDSHEDVLEILKFHKVNKNGIMHCYSGNPIILEEFIKLGYYISFGRSNHKI
ncbi:MAG: TatD family hydrolase [Clostridia bacterium]